MDGCRVIASIIIPPLGVFLQVVAGCSRGVEIVIMGNALGDDREGVADAAADVIFSMLGQ